MRSSDVLLLLFFRHLLDLENCTYSTYLPHTFTFALPEMHQLVHPLCALHHTAIRRVVRRVPQLKTTLEGMVRAVFGDVQTRWNEVRACVMCVCAIVCVVRVRACMRDCAHACARNVTTPTAR